MSGLAKTVMVSGGLAVFAILCAGEASAQVSSTEVYRLSRIGDQDLPVVVEQSGDCRDEVQAATLTLNTDGRWLLETQEQQICGESTSTDTDSEDGRYHIQGETIHFMDDDGEPIPADDDPDEIELERLREATRTENGLRVVIADDDAVLEFTR